MDFLVCADSGLEESSAIAVGSVNAISPSLFQEMLLVHLAFRFLQVEPPCHAETYELQVFQTYSYRIGGGLFGAPVRVVLQIFSSAYSAVAFKMGNMLQGRSKLNSAARSSCASSS